MHNLINSVGQMCLFIWLIFIILSLSVMTKIIMENYHRLNIKPKIRNVVFMIVGCILGPWFFINEFHQKES